MTPYRDPNMPILAPTRVRWWRRAMMRARAWWRVRLEAPGLNDIMLAIDGPNRDRYTIRAAIAMRAFGMTAAQAVDAIRVTRDMGANGRQLAEVLVQEDNVEPYYDLVRRLKIAMEPHGFDQRGLRRFLDYVTAPEKVARLLEAKRWRP